MKDIKTLIKNFSPSPDIYITRYHVLLPFIESMGLSTKWDSILEVGTARGDGAIYLRDLYPNASIDTMDLPIPDEDHEVEPEKLESLLAGIDIRYFRIGSPPETKWEDFYDFCCIDISSKAQIHIRSFNYWKDYINPQGVLILVVPKSSPAKIKERETFISYLKEHEVKFKVEQEFFIFPL